MRPEKPDSMPDAPLVDEEERIKAGILDLLARRPADHSICPSEVARALAPDDDAQWRSLMSRVRQAAARLAQQDQLRITRGHQTLNPARLLGGPVRLRRGRAFPNE